MHDVFALLSRSMALDLDAALYIKRVPTKENLADDPSRERYALLERMQAKRVEPTLDDRFLNAQAWCSLSATAHKEWVEQAPVDVNKENIIPIE